MKPALTEEEWALGMYSARGFWGEFPLFIDGVRQPQNAPKQAAFPLCDEPFGFTDDMVEAIYTLLWFSGGASECQRCLHEGQRGGRMKGGNGIVGDPQCVATCSVCGWFPRKDGWVREHASQVARAIKALLPPGDK